MSIVSDSTGSKMISLPLLNVNALTSVDNSRKAEILWCFKAASSGFSFASSTGNAELFQMMFPDSKIAESFSLDETKMSYLISFGIGVYLKKRVVDDLLSSGSYYCIEVDETVNHAQHKQFDIHVRFCSTATNQVEVYYFQSFILGHAEAHRLKSCVLEALSNAKIPLQRFLVLSCDGPNVNKLLKTFLEGEVSSARGSELDLIDAGQCNIHVVHNAFHHGMDALQWDIDVFLSHIHSWFHISSVRKEDFALVQEALEISHYLPKSFAKIRWLSITPALRRVLEIYGSLEKYFLEWLPTNKKEVLSSDRYKLIAKHLHNRLTLAKIQFLLAASQSFHNFLVLFQTEGPLIHILYIELKKLLLALLNQFVEPHLLLEKSATELIKINLSHAENLLHLKKISIGIASSVALKESNSSSVDKEAFLQDYRSFYVQSTKYLISHFPLNNSFIRDVGCLSPNGSDKETYFKRLILHLVSRKIITTAQADAAITEWKEYAASPFASQVRNECIQNERVDFFWNKIFEKLRLDNLKRVVHICITVAHGNSDVERGFSENNQVVTKYRTCMKEHTICGLRLAKNFVRHMGGKVNKIPITKELLSNCQYARFRYEQFLQKQRDDDKRKLVHEEAAEKERMEKLAMKRKAEDRESELALASKIIQDGTKDLAEASARKDLLGISAAQKIIDMGQIRLTAAIDMNISKESKQ